jgi:hypothetical protein
MVTLSSNEWRLFLEDIRTRVAKSFALALGISAIAWAAYAATFYRAEVSIAAYSRAILSSETYSAAQIDALRKTLDATSMESLRPLAFNDVAVVRLLILETELAAGQSEQIASDRAELDSAVTAALAAAPSNSFLWLVKYWLEDPSVRSTERGRIPLRMSYILGPNEGWIALRRNPLALAEFASLPKPMAGQVLSEFATMVQSGFYQEASNIIAGADRDLRELLLGRLDQIKEADRNDFAKVLEQRGLDQVPVPGLVKRPARPF